jgi:hypothetical protein
LFDKKLSLTDEQRNSVYNLYLSQIQQMDNIREQLKQSADKEDLKNQAKQVLSATDSGMKGILTDEQLQKYDNIKKVLRERMKQRALKNRSQKGRG